MGSVAHKVDSWIAQRDEIADELNAVIDRARAMLSQLAGGDGVTTTRLARFSTLSATAAPVEGAKRGPGRPPGSGRVRRGGRRKGFKMSAEARAKIAAAQRARWAKQKKEKNT